jgi:CMP-N,N'-diacetyllegionaminic acid synthase
MKTLITICARGGSKGIPGKNIKSLNGIPLIAYSIQMAQRFAELHDATIALSTDSDEIKAVAKKYGLETQYQRPEELAIDQAGKIPVLRHVLQCSEKAENKQFDFVLDLDVTSPMRTLDDLERGRTVIESDSNALILFSVNAAARNPYFNMVERKENGYYQLVAKMGDVLSRQSAPKVFDMNASFYFYKRQFFDLNLNTPITPQSLIYEMPHECFDLDHPMDFEFLEFLLSNKKLNFEIWKS